MSSVGAVYDRPFWLNHRECAVTDRAYSGPAMSAVGFWEAGGLLNCL